MGERRGMVETRAIWERGRGEVDGGLVVEDDHRIVRGKGMGNVS